MAVERRQKSDRRRSPTRPLSLHSLRGRRRQARRREEDRNYYVDRYERHYFVLVSLILVLCILDAYFTLKIIDFGGKELNRFMFAFLYKSPAAALVFKYGVTVVCLTFLLIHKNFLLFGRFRVSSLIYVFFSIYLTLVVYEGAIFLSHPWAPGF